MLLVGENDVCIMQYLPIKIPNELLFDMVNTLLGSHLPLLLLWISPCLD